MFKWFKKITIININQNLSKSQNCGVVMQRTSNGYENHNKYYYQKPFKAQAKIQKWKRKSKSLLSTKSSLTCGNSNILNWKAYFSCSCNVSFNTMHSAECYIQIYFITYYLIQAITTNIFKLLRGVTVLVVK